MNNFNLNTDQLNVLSVLDSGQNVFLTGPAGTGKSEIIKTFVASHPEKQVVLCAPTGKAAYNIGGNTIHSVFRINPSELCVTDTKNYNNAITDVLLAAEIIIIDEISLVSIQIFEFVAATLKTIEQLGKMSRESKNQKYSKCVAKKQIIIVGDFLQLPPIGSDDNEFKFAFESRFWSQMNFENIILTKIVRQNTKEFITNLNLVRLGDVKGLDWISQNSLEYRPKKAIWLCGTRREVEKRNEIELNKLDGTDVQFVAEIKGDANRTDLIAPVILNLKVGCRVMATVNLDKQKIYNGAMGQVLSISENIIKVRWDDGSISLVKKWEKSVTRYCVRNGKICQRKVGSIIQFPICLAYAITIHKAQGLGFDRVILSPAGFAPGMLYTALSRCRTIDGLFIKKASLYQKLIVSSKVLKFYDSIGANVHVDHRGGKRDNAGRKPNYGCKTVITRIPNYLVKLVEFLKIQSIDENKGEKIVESIIQLISKGG